MKYFLLVLYVFLSSACGKKNIETTMGDIVVFIGVLTVFGIAAIAVVFDKRIKLMWFLITLWILVVFLGAGRLYYIHFVV